MIFRKLQHLYKFSLLKTTIGLISYRFCNSFNKLKFILRHEMIYTRIFAICFYTKQIGIFGVLFNPGQNVVSLVVSLIYSYCD